MPEPTGAVSAGDNFDENVVTGGLSMAKFDNDYVVKHLLAGNQTDVFVSNQNTFGSVPFTVPGEAGCLALILVKTSAALTDSDLATAFSGTGDVAQILAQDTVASVTGKQIEIEGRVHLKYADSVTQS